MPLGLFGVAVHRVVSGHKTVNEQAIAEGVDILARVIAGL